ncbi:MAG: GAF domain-containing protein [Flavisolibacter sp.]
MPINHNADFCGKVPLHQTNLVQPHGYLLVIDRTHFQILQLSENTEELLGKPSRELVNTPLQDYLPDSQVQKIKERLETGVAGRLPFLFRFSNGDHLTTVKIQQDYFIMEVEKHSRSAQENDSFIRVYEDLKYLMAAIEEARTTEETCRIAIEELKKISGFDKIMLYRFDEEWNGDVIAEVREAGMDSYLGLKFPASDIPAQARELYKKIPYRLIPDIYYEPVKLYPVINPVTKAFTDLTDSNLRSVAAVHIEYLKNMKVEASMSTRIVKDDQLWGLIACHHRRPKHLSFELCSVFELISHVLSAKISAMQNKDVFSYKSEQQQLQSRLVDAIYREENLLGALNKQEEALLDLLAAGGVAIVLNKNVETFGAAPSPAAIGDLVFWLQSRNINKTYQEPGLVATYEPAEAYARVASGLLVLPIQPEKGHYILAFRPEAVSQVNWGGNPHEAVQFEADRVKYHPRASFQLWQQVVQKTAIPWKPEEIEIAENFRHSVVEFTLNKMYN